MKALVFHAPRDARLEDVSKPTAGPGEVVCRVAAVGICATDLEVYQGVMIYFRLGMLSFPWTSGHEWSGIVESTGEDVTDLKPGDRVVGEVTVSCGSCEACLTGKPQLCWPRTEIGVTGRYQGALAEYIVVPARHAVKIPAGVSLQEAAMVEPAGVSLHGIDPGDRVVVTGDGPIGVLAAQEAKASGASTVVLYGSRDYKMQAALDTGIDRTVSRHDPDAKTKLIDALGGKPADSLIETSGNPGAFELVPSAVKLGGKLLVLGLYGVTDLSIDMDYLVANEIQLHTSLGASATFPRVLRMMQSKQLNVLPLQGYYPFARIKEAVEDVVNKKTRSVKTLVVNEELLD